jgi:hypothetical protein
MVKENKKLQSNNCYMYQGDHGAENLEYLKFYKIIFLALERLFFTALVEEQFPLSSIYTRQLINNCKHSSKELCWVVKQYQEAWYNRLRTQDLLGTHVRLT